MIHPLARIALAQFLADKTGHHAAYPLLADDRVAGVVDGDVVFEVDALVGWGHGGLFGQEGGGLGSWHFVEVGGVVGLGRWGVALALVCDCSFGGVTVEWVWEVFDAIEADGMDRWWLD